MEAVLVGPVHNREHYRVAYPSNLRPRLYVLGHPFDVLDLSERGLRFRLADAVPPQAGNELRGELRFHQGESLPVVGTIVRVTEGEVAVSLDQGVPLRVIMAEQRRLLDRQRRASP